LITDVYKNYKEWKIRAKRQGYYSRTNFSFGIMKNILSEILKHNVPQIARHVPLNLPKLKKASNVDAPKLNLPKLKKINNGV
jgi:hypothetical protein